MMMEIWSKCISYSFGSPVRNWDKKRQEWLKCHPLFIVACDGVVVVAECQSLPVQEPNRTRSITVESTAMKFVYNNAFLHPKMVGVWTNLPPVRAAMVAHSEVEWI
ncbi:hypothetical protein HYC85_018551 [Camellia sinensis]|uniref:Uncharacterized protein n=1 Tax=Camellia sinensis TaxID=4442 RepID=A0A7J7GYA6_CAMSI|nr:hypothetical protein HYC85_018551 [Camellia sinensis]